MKKSPGAIPVHGQPALAPVEREVTVAREADFAKRLAEHERRIEALELGSGDMRAPLTPTR